MKKKRVILAVIALILAGALLTGVILQGMQGKQPAEIESTFSAEESISETAELLESETAESESETAAETEETAEEEAVTESAAETTIAVETNASKPSTSSKKPTMQETQPLKRFVTFPYEFSDKKIIVRDIRMYEGVFVEDGSDEEIQNVAAVILENKSDKALELIKMTIYQGDEVLNFTAANVPSGSTVIAQEEHRKEFQKENYADCSVQVAYLDEFPMEDDKIEIVENENGSLTVKNISGEDIPCVRIFYKYYLESENVYVGGITYNVKLNDLKKDNELTIRPSHYAAGKSKVVMVRSYDEKQ